MQFVWPAMNATEMLHHNHHFLRLRLTHLPHHLNQFSPTTSISPEIITWSLEIDCLVGQKYSPAQLGLLMQVLLALLGVSGLCLPPLEFQLNCLVMAGQSLPLALLVIFSIGGESVIAFPQPTIHSQTAGQKWL